MVLQRLLLSLNNLVHVRDLSEVTKCSVAAVIRRLQKLKTSCVGMIVYAEDRHKMLE